jgi:hypothetical protein
VDRIPVVVALLFLPVVVVEAEEREVTGTVKTRTCQINLQTIYTIYLNITRSEACCRRGMISCLFGVNGDIARFLSIVSRNDMDHRARARMCLNQPAR